MRYLELKSVLKSIVSDEENNWSSKLREKVTFEKLLSLGWLHNGDFLVKKKKFKTYLKGLYFGYNHEEFTTKDMEFDYYVLHEPFGNKSAPDFLFVTPNGLFGIEDKSSEDNEISWNTGSPGENKIITYFDRVEKKVYLLHSADYGWDQEMSKKYLLFKQSFVLLAKEEFKKVFGDMDGPISNMGYYARPMLVDRNKVREVYDPNETNVDKHLKKYLEDDTWQNQNNQSMVNLTQEPMSVNSL